MYVRLQCHDRDVKNLYIAAAIAVTGHNLELWFSYQSLRQRKPLDPNSILIMCIISAKFLLFDFTMIHFTFSKLGFLGLIAMPFFGKH